MRNRNAIILIIAAVLVIAICVPVIIVLQNKMSAPVKSETVGEVIASDLAEPGSTAATFPYEVLQIGDQTYRYNDRLRNYLFLGIDRHELTETETGHANAGQCDALFLLSWDTETGKTTLISIPRDTITEITVYSYDGLSHYKDDDHISLSYAYGDGESGSCTLSVKAVSNLFAGIPVWGYMALDLDSLAVIMDTVGNLQVTLPNNSLAYLDDGYTAGTSLELSSANVETFVRSRDTQQAGSPMDRLERQQVFLDALLGRMKTLGDTGVAKLYLNLGDYMVTNISVSLLQDVMSSMAAEAPSAWTVPGTSVTAEYDEYHVDQDAFQQKLLDAFYVAE